MSDALDMIRRCAIGQQNAHSIAPDIPAPPVDAHPLVETPGLATVFGEGIIEGYRAIGSLDTDREPIACG